MLRPMKVTNVLRALSLKAPSNCVTIRLQNPPRRSLMAFIQVALERRRLRSLGAAVFSTQNRLADTRGGRARASKPQHRGLGASRFARGHHRNQRQD